MGWLDPKPPAYLALKYLYMSTGIVFDIKEFTVHDGPGVRTTVFLKGLPAGLHVVP